MNNVKLEVFQLFEMRESSNMVLYSWTNDNVHPPSPYTDYLYLNHPHTKLKDIDGDPSQLSHSSSDYTTQIN